MRLLDDYLMARADLLTPVLDKLAAPIVSASPCVARRLPPLAPTFGFPKFH
jgi:hypothetical protein